MTDCVDMELDDEAFLRELAEMNRRSRIHSLKASGIQEPALANWTFASAEDSPSIQMARRYVDNWPQMKENNLGLLLWGDVGTGKSFAAACIANALLESGVPVLMTNFSKILNQLGGMYSEERYKYIASFSSFELLIIDDLGIERNTEYALEQVYAVIDERYKSKKPLIITTNLTISQIRNAADVAHARIYSRVLELCTPVLARPDPDGGYEIISDHRRCRAAELVGLETLPVIVREMDDDEAIIAMIDSNLQRETILPSERAWAYKMKLDAIKHQGARSDLTSSQVGMKLQTLDIVGKEAGDSRNQVHRYIRLTNLIPELMDMVDEKKIAFNPAVKLSYLTREEQAQLLEAMDYAQATPSLSQAQRLKKQSQEGTATLDSMCEIMNEVKKEPTDRVIFRADSLRKYFPKATPTGR